MIEDDEDLRRALEESKKTFDESTRFKNHFEDNFEEEPIEESDVDEASKALIKKIQDED